MDRIGKLQGAVVVELAQPQSAVLLGDVHPESAKLGKASNYRIRDLVVALDLPGIDRSLEERLETPQERLSLLPMLGGRDRRRMDEVEPESTGVELATK